MHDANTNTTGRFVRIGDYANETGISRHTLRKMAEDGRCPPIIRFSARMVGWWRADVDAWQEATRSQGSAR